MNAGRATGCEWRRSSRCNGGACVEVLAQGAVVLVRNSADPEGPTLTISRETWEEWLLWLKAGLKDEF